MADINKLAVTVRNIAGFEYLSFELTDINKII